MIKSLSLDLKQAFAVLLMNSPGTAPLHMN